MRLTVEQIERIATDASDYDNWVADKKTGEPAYPIEPHIVRALCDMAVAAREGTVVYQCPRCATSMEIDPSAKPKPASPPEGKEE